MSSFARVHLLLNHDAPPAHIHAYQLDPNRAPEVFGVQIELGGASVVVSGTAAQVEDLIDRMHVAITAIAPQPVKPAPADS
jgi:hypothetical protein